MAALLVTTILLLHFFSTILHSVYCADPQESDDKVISNMKKVKDKIFKDYDKTVRPESHHNHTTYMYFDIVPGYVIELDEERSLFTLDSWFVFHWRDKRLQWDPSQFENLTSLSVPDDTIWQPDLRVYNGHTSNIDPMKNVPLIIHSNGAIWWFPPATVTAFCDVTTPTGSYPRDTHQCNITIGCWTHDGWQIDIDVPYEEKMYWDFFSNTNPRWEIDKENSKIYKVVKKYECCEEPYIWVDSSFTLKRRPPSQMQVIFVPSILVMMLTLTMFWIPSDSSKKITLGASLLIVLTALTIYCAALTKSPRTQLLAVSFVQATMIAVTVALCLEIIIINLTHINGARPPEFLLKVMSGSLGNYICIWAPWRQSIPGDKVRLQEDSEPTNVEPTPQQEWLVVATGFDRILFVLYIIVFAAIHQV